MKPVLTGGGGGMKPTNSSNYMGISSREGQIGKLGGMFEDILIVKIV